MATGVPPEIKRAAQHEETDMRIGLAGKMCGELAVCKRRLEPGTDWPFVWQCWVALLARKPRQPHGCPSVGLTPVTVNKTVSSF